MIIKQNIALFIEFQKQEQLLLKSIMIIILNQFILGLYQTHKNLLGKVWIVLLIQLIAVISNYQKNETIQKQV